MRPVYVESSGDAAASRSVRHGPILVQLAGAPGGGWQAVPIEDRRRRGASLFRGVLLGRDAFDLDTPHERPCEHRLAVAPVLPARQMAHDEIQAVASFIQVERRTSSAPGHDRPIALGPGTGPGRVDHEPQILFELDTHVGLDRDEVRLAALAGRVQPEARRAIRSCWLPPEVEGKHVGLAAIDEPNVANRNRADDIGNRGGIEYLSLPASNQRVGHALAQYRRTRAAALPVELAAAATVSLPPATAAAPTALPMTAPALCGAGGTRVAVDLRPERCTTRMPTAAQS